MLAAGGRYEGPEDWGLPLVDEARARTSREAYLARLRDEGTKVH